MITLMKATSTSFAAGKRQSHRAGGYERGSGKAWRPKVLLEPGFAEQIDEWSERANVSVAWLVGVLAQHAPIDPETGLPECIRDLKLPGDKTMSLFEAREAS